MKRIITIVLMICVLAVLFTGCDKECTGCGNGTAKYIVTFGPTGGEEYICEKCYDKRFNNENIATGAWIVERID